MLPGGDCSVLKAWQGLEKEGSYSRSQTARGKDINDDFLLLYLLFGCQAIIGCPHLCATQRCVALATVVIVAKVLTINENCNNNLTLTFRALFDIVAKSNVQ